MTQVTALHGWNRRSFLANLGAGALALAGLASPSPLLRRSWAAGMTTKLVSTWNAFDVLDPYVKYDVPAAALNLNLYDNLLRYQGNPPQLVPWLAERDEALDGGRRWRFYLRPGLTFHDGSPLTGEAVRFSFERLLQLLALMKGDVHIVHGNLPADQLEKLEKHPRVTVTPQESMRTLLIRMHNQREPFTDINVRLVVTDAADIWIYNTVEHVPVAKIVHGFQFSPVGSGQEFWPISMEARA